MRTYVLCFLACLIVGLCAIGAASSEIVHHTQSTAGFLHLQNILSGIMAASIFAGIAIPRIFTGDWNPYVTGTGLCLAFGPFAVLILTRCILPCESGL